MSKNLIRIAISHVLPIKQDDGKVARSPPEKTACMANVAWTVPDWYDWKRALKLLKAKEYL
ncbi:hypothetical protein SPSIL_045350 [Sporomusa silvacetica DSM 10669]|uniref:Uncharacterized protein n=1 Tax=Sporomusa silvacetica DSM 10669 TaxID=1123289 RepID=A0ABZ3IRJ9_9FIRM